MVWIFTHEEPNSFEILGSQFSVLGDVPNWDSGQTQNLSSIGLWSHPKSEFSRTESPDPDPWESHTCLLGSCSKELTHCSAGFCWFLLNQLCMYQMSCLVHLTSENEVPHICLLDYNIILYYFKDILDKIIFVYLCQIITPSTF